MIAPNRSCYAILLIGFFLMTAILLGEPETQESDHFTGEWRWAIEAGAHSAFSVSARMSRDRDRLSGFVFIGEKDIRLKITDGQIDGTKLSFKAKDVREDLVIEYRYSGVLDGDEIKGKVRISWTRPSGEMESSEISWNAHRVRAETGADGGK